MVGSTRLRSIQYPWYFNTVSIRSRRTRAERTEEIGQRVLVAARRSFSRDGYHGTTLDAVALAAGFTKGAVYSRYPSKADLFLALLGQEVDARIRECTEVLGSARDLESAAKALSTAFMLEVNSDRAFWLAVLEFQIAAARDTELRPRVRREVGRLRDAIGALITEIFAHSGLTADPREVEAVVRIAIATSSGAVLERSSDVDSFPDALLERAAVALVRDLVPKTARTTKARTA
jgi:AcrR family transcriptional regulator